ncbi:MAG: phosphate starvation-inducible protein PhoH, partial [Sandarakinorhabdus sp.]
MRSNTAKPGLMGRKPHRGGNPPGPSDRVKLEIQFDKVQLLGALFGQYDQNLIALEGQLGVYISARGNRVVVEGQADAAARTRDVLTSLYARVLKGDDIDTGDVIGAVALAAEPMLEGLVHADTGTAPTAAIRTRRKTIVARSPTQVRYIEALGAS